MPAVLQVSSYHTNSFMVIYKIYTLWNFVDFSNPPNLSEDLSVLKKKKSD
jgi:hypothetical protein